MSEEINEVIDQEVIEATETDVEDVLDATDEVDVEETVEEQEGTTEESEESEEQEVDTEFNPDEIDFDDDEDLYKFGDYNLSKFKDVLDVSSDEVVEDIKNTAKELSEHGFTQEQIEYLIEKSMDNTPQEVKEPTREEVMKELKENLSVAERRDYKKVGSYLKEQLKGTELEGYYKEAMSNPGVYKLVHTLYDKVTNQGRPLGKVANTNEETRKKSISFSGALDEYTNYMKAHLTEDNSKYVNDLIGRLSEKDRDKFKNVLGL